MSSQQRGWIGSGSRSNDPRLLETYMLLCTSQVVWDVKGSDIGVPAPCKEQHHGDGTQSERSTWISLQAAPLQRCWEVKHHLANRIHTQSPLANWRHDVHIRFLCCQGVMDYLIAWSTWWDSVSTEGIPEALVLALMATLTEETWHRCLCFESTAERESLERLLEVFVRNIAVHSEENMKGLCPPAVFTVDWATGRQNGDLSSWDKEKVL